MPAVSPVYSLEYAMEKDNEVLVKASKRILHSTGPIALLKQGTFTITNLCHYTVKVFI